MALHMVLQDEEHCNPELLGTDLPQHNHSYSCSCSGCAPVAQMGCMPLTQHTQESGYRNPKVVPQVLS
ncbi:hypothetical protein Hanom_Chr02g00096011 [Helianthus anomalus]